MSSTIVNIKEKSPKTSSFFKVKGDALQTAISNATASKAKICSDGGCSTATLNKALDGNRIISAMANAIVKGLGLHGVKTTRDALFVSAE
jgi:hypothetical protein